MRDHPGECSLFPYERTDVLTIQETGQSAGWMITTFDLPDVWKNTEGQGVKIAVLDSTPGSSPVLCSSLTGRIFTTTIEDLFLDNTSETISTDRGEEIKKSQAISVWSIVNKNGEWQRIHHIIRHRYQGPIVRINLRSGLVDVTPNHSVIRTDGSPANASKISNHEKLCLSGCLDTKSLNLSSAYNDQTASFLGMWSAFGSFGDDVDEIRFLHKSDEVLALARIFAFTSFSLQGTIKPYKDSGFYELTLRDKHLREWIKDRCTVSSGVKKIPDMILNSPSNIVDSFLNGFGDISNLEWSIRDQLLICGLIALLEMHERGLFTVFYETDRDVVKINVLDKGKNDDREDVISCSIYDYDGWVYDLETENHTFGCGIGSVLLHNTGVDLDHPDLAGSLLPGKNIINPNSLPDDDCGHGCVDSDTFVLTNIRGPEKIHDLYENFDLIPSHDPVTGYWTKDIRSYSFATTSYDCKNHSFVESKIEYIHKIRIKNEIVKISFACGKTIRLTKWHPVYLVGSNGEKDILRKPASDVVKGDIILNRIANDAYRVEDIQIEQADEDFYDFTIEGTNNYLANDVIVSNTHVSGIITARNNSIGMVGVAPGSMIIPVKVLDRQGNGLLSNVAKGVIYAIEAGADIITMSLGSKMPVPEIEQAIKLAASKGIPVFVAAGNAGNTDDVYFPAAYEETIAVGAIDDKFERALFSNTGMNLDFMAPGVSILSTVPDNWYSIMSGTSMATPFLAGIAALLVSHSRSNNNNPQLRSVDDFRSELKKRTIPIHGIGANERFYQGFGIVDVRSLFS